MQKNLLLLFTFGWGLLIFRLTTTPQLVVTQDSVLQMLIMSGAHFFFFGIQAALIFLSLPQSHNRLMSYVPSISTSLYGLVIELLQRGIPGRSADPIDWLLDTLGALIFVYIVRKYSQDVNHN